MLKRIFKKNKEREESIKKISEKVDKFSNFLSQKLEGIKKEAQEIREKSKNLKETNYQLALSHLEKGNVSEALLRLRIMLKFWPDHIDAHYLKAYCLAHKKKFAKAKQEIETVFKKYPNQYQKKFDLLLGDINRAMEIDD